MRRDLRLDLLRGVCLVSMVVGHLAQGRWPDTAAHPLLVVDGAAGFVLLSGTVLGRVQRRRPDLRAPLRRAGRIWAVHAALLGAAVLVKALTGRPDFIPAPAALGGLVPALAGVATLRVQPDWFGVLPFYVGALALTPVVVVALRRGRWRAVLAVSAGVYALSQVGSATWTPADLWPGSTPWDWGGWQLLFVGGLVAGWRWEALLAFGRRHRAALLGVGGGLTVGVGALAHVVGTAALDPLFDKYQVRPGVPLVVLAGAPAAYWLAGRVLAVRASAAAGRWVATVGANTLQGYVALCAAQFVAFSWWPDRPLSASLALVAAVLLATWALALRKAARKAAARPAAVPAPVPTPAPVAALASSAA